MVLTVLVTAMLVTQAQASPGASMPEPPPCSSGTAPADSATTELCTGMDDMRSASALPASAAERTRGYERAIAHLRRATTSANSAVATLALEQLADVYDATHLNQPDRLEEVLRELIGRHPENLKPMYRLAQAQEQRGLIELAEATFLDARHRQPESEEPNAMLAQFYARRVTALHAKNLPPSPETFSNPGEPDASGVYRIGNALKPPAREGVPQYPQDARAAGIRGQVITELVIDPAGNVVDARIVRSVPMLDQAALDAVRTWKFAPTIVNGQPVPVRMTTTVNFQP
ncbi:MAG: TonB family protein [Vicinamibacterales bacterium]